MGDWINSLLSIKINFAESHTFFPTIITWLLLILLLVIVLVRGIPFFRGFKQGRNKISIWAENFDKIRFWGTILFTIIYFLSMDYVGSFFPNMGFGFLIMSMPFMFALSLLYVHNFNRKKFIVISLNSIIAPSIAWYVLGNLFNISLP